MLLVWILVKPVPLRSMLNKSMTCTENCNACSWHWSTERAPFSTTMPDCMLHNQFFKNWMNHAMKFCLIHHIHWPLTNWLLLLQASQQLFAGKTLLQPAGCRKCFPRVCQIPKQFLCYRNRQTFLIGKNVLTIMVPILINKVVFEPSYNDWKFTVQKCNYLCTNLINF